MQPCARVGPLQQAPWVKGEQQVGCAQCVERIVCPARCGVVAKMLNHRQLFFGTGVRFAVAQHEVCIIRVR